MRGDDLTAHGASNDPFDGEQRPSVKTLKEGIALMLDLVFKNGDREAFPYAYLSRIRWEREGTITLHYPTDTVTIVGRSLGSVYSHLLMHRVLEVRESDTSIYVQPNAATIQAIEVHDRQCVAD